MNNTDKQVYPIPESKQAAFDIAWHGVLKQGKPSLIVDGRCAYLAPDGCKCSIGHMIPDGHPAQKALTSVLGLRRLFPDLFHPSADNNFLLELQLSHDSAASCGEPFTGRFKEHMRLLAVYFGLKVPDEQY